MISVGILHSRRKFLDLHLSTLEKSKHKDRLKVFLMTQGDGIEYCQSLKHNLNLEVVEFSYDNNFMSKVRFLIDSGEYSIRMDEDLFVNHHILDFMIDNQDKLEENLLIAPCFITGVPTYDMFEKKYKNIFPEMFERLHNIFKNIKLSKSINCINPDCISLPNLFEEYKSLEQYFGTDDYFKHLGKINHVYKGLHPVRINSEAHNLIIDTILQTNLLFDKQDYKLLSYNYEQYPYYCNHVHFIKNTKWKKAIEEFSHGFDEVSLNEYRKHNNLTYAFVQNGLAVHFMYSNLTEHPNNLNLYSSASNNNLEVEFYERTLSKSR